MSRFVYVFLVSAVLFSTGHTSLIARLLTPLRDNVKTTVQMCSEKGGLGPDVIIEGDKAGKTPPPEYGCIYKCIMMENPRPLMTEDGEITLPLLTPAETRKCIEESTAGVTDLCDKAHKAATCWVANRSAIKDILGF